MTRARRRSSRANAVLGALTVQEKSALWDLLVAKATRVTLAYARGRLSVETNEPHAIGDVLVRVLGVLGAQQ